MNSKSVEQLLMEIDTFSKTKKLSKREIAQKLDIPYNTFKKWFLKGKSKRKPSTIHIERIMEFFESQESGETRWKELWMKILTWWETQHRYLTVKEFADEIGWDALHLNNYLHNEEMPPKLVIEKIARTINLEVPALESILPEAQRKTEKIKHLLLFLEEELRWFRDGPKEVRDILRKELNLNDVGYISSLLTMLGEEDKFRRWLALTTSRFSFFKKKEGHKK